ncbi:hypothetical protein [Mucilaginibacter sp. 22184]|uniref:hypothetical protein n=1 Tax=Mucilaginibacter sp. 22184 TaxID=3453887 RepID=UPI003F86C52A
MTIAEFNLLNLKEQGDLTFDGNFLGDRSQGDYKVALYRVGGFYVEAFYYTVSNQIVWIEAFGSNERLVPYIAHIKFNS